jgi:hypothetical protein
MSVPVFSMGNFVARRVFRFEFPTGVVLKIRSPSSSE